MARSRKGSDFNPGASLNREIKEQGAGVLRTWFSVPKFDGSGSGSRFFHRCELKSGGLVSPEGI